MNLEKILISLFIKVKVGENMKKLRKIKVSNDRKVIIFDSKVNIFNSIDIIYVLRVISF